VFCCYKSHLLHVLSHVTVIFEKPASLYWKEATCSRRVLCYVSCRIHCC